MKSTSVRVSEAVTSPLQRASISEDSLAPELYTHQIAMLKEEEEERKMLVMCHIHPTSNCVTTDSIYKNLIYISLGDRRPLSSEPIYFCSPMMVRSPASTVF